MIVQMKRKRKKDGAHAPILLSNKNETALRFASAYLFLYQSATQPELGHAHRAR
jgi:hypothetical protein